MGEASNRIEPEAKKGGSNMTENAMEDLKKTLAEQFWTKEKAAQLGGKAA
jgi:hypothetical protein